MAEDKNKNMEKPQLIKKKDRIQNTVNALDVSSSPSESSVPSAKPEPSLSESSENSTENETNSLTAKRIVKRKKVVVTTKVKPVAPTPVETPQKEIQSQKTSSPSQEKEVKAVVSKPVPSTPKENAVISKPTPSTPKENVTSDKKEESVRPARTGVQELKIVKRRVSKVGTGKAGNLAKPQPKPAGRGNSGTNDSNNSYNNRNPRSQNNNNSHSPRPNTTGDSSKKMGGGNNNTTAPAGAANNKRIFRKKSSPNKSSYRKNSPTENEKGFAVKKNNAHVANPVPKEINILGSISVADLAKKMNLRGSDLISKLIPMGMMVTINHTLDAETATILAEEFGCKINVVSLYDETLIERAEDKHEDLHPRSPIVTVMGHVDHGKTSLLEAIRQVNITDTEHGGITQHIAAYSVSSEKGNITFLDTPGHAAFTLMRARGAQITDLVVLVVAADDGIMPQTIEALNHAKDSGVPIIVAINKIDKPDAKPDQIKQQLSEYDLIAEDWGGHTQFIPVSALKKQGIHELLDAILLETEVLELKANPNSLAEGKIVESQVEQGRGITATVIIQHGTLKIGDPFVAGIYSGKVRGMFDSMGVKMKEALPSMPVEVTGFTGIPEAGDPFQVTQNEKEAKNYSQKRVDLKRQEANSSYQKVTLDNLYDSIEAGSVKELRVIIKGDVQGSVEAIRSMLEKLSTDEIRLRCIHAAAGTVVESDVQLAIASNAIIIGFHVRPTPKAQVLIDANKIDFRRYNIVYEITDDITLAMEGLLSPEFEENVVGEAEVRAIFKVSRLGEIAGCMITTGKVLRRNDIHLIRNKQVIYTGPLTSLQREKDSVKEVREGFECGIVINEYKEALQEGDIIRSFEMQEIKKTL